MKTKLLDKLKSDRCRIIAPLMVNIEYDAPMGSFVATSDSAGVFGMGLTEGKALDALRKNIVSMWESLNNGEPVVGGYMAQRKRVLDRYIEGVEI